MNVSSCRDGQPFVGNSASATGDMWGEIIVGGSVNVTTVVFAPGSRTCWHRHSGGQVLLVTHGKGYVRTAEGQTAAVSAGDVVVCPGGEEHWHGATADSVVIHTAITHGTTDLLGPVADEQYAEVSTGPSDEG